MKKEKDIVFEEGVLCDGRRVESGLLDKALFDGWVVVE